MGEVVSVDSSSVNLDRGDYVVGHGIIAVAVGVLDDGNHTVAIEVSLIWIPMLLLLRDHLVVIVVWDLVLWKVPAPWISSNSLYVVIVTMGGRRREDVGKAQFTWW